MRTLGCVIALLVVWPIGAAAAPPREVSTPLQADWELKPSIDAVSAAYPQLPMALGLQASTILQCGVDPAGVLHDCNVIEVEGPKGVGFEAASLSLTQMFRLRPDRTPSGRGKSGIVRIPLAFRLPSWSSEFPATGSEPDPSMLTIAREQVGRFAVGQQLDLAFERSNKQLANTLTLGVDPATREEMMSDLRAAQVKVRAEVLEFQARVLAANLTRQQIQSGLDYDKTSGAQVMRKSGDAIRRRGEQFISNRTFWLLYAVHQEFCRAHDCKSASVGDVPPASPAWV